VHHFNAEAEAMPPFLKLSCPSLPELWNFGQRRKATMREALNYIWKQLEKKEP
jgi:hypothetical protein